MGVQPKKALRDFGPPVPHWGSPDSRIKPARTPNLAKLTIIEPLTIRHAGSLKGNLDAMLRGDDNTLELDLSQVEQMDGPGYQCLVAFAQKAQSLGKATLLTQVPAPVAKRLRLAHTELHFSETAS